MPPTPKMAVCVKASVVVLLSWGLLVTARTTRRRDTTLETTTQPFNCSLEHRPHPTSENMFQKKWNDVWEDYPCPVTGLVWNQDTCRCEEGPGGLDPCAEYSAVPDAPQKYTRTVWGVKLPLACGFNLVWSQEQCTCRDAIPGEIQGAPVDPCELMLQASFNETFADEARGSYIGRWPRTAAKITKVSGAVGGGAVCLKKGFISVPAFARNELSRTFHIAFRVKVDADEETGAYNVLVSNGCAFDAPSVRLAYRQRDRTFKLDITDITTVTRTCSDRGSAGGWKEVSLEVIKQKVVLRVNGRTCVEDDQTELSDQPLSTRCALSFGGDNRNGTKTMTGCFDEITVHRFCVGE